MFLIFTRTTSADLSDNKVVKNNQISAATLDFNTAQTVDNSQSLSLFQIKGIIPGGLQVNSLRLLSDSATRYNFTVTINPSSQICDSVNIQFIHHQNLYDGSLSNLNFEFTTTDKIVDLISVLKLSTDVNFSQNQQLCIFDIVVTASPVTPSKFNKTIKLGNHLAVNVK